MTFFLMGWIRIIAYGPGFSEARNPDPGKLNPDLQPLLYVKSSNDIDTSNSIKERTASVVLFNISFFPRFAPWTTPRWKPARSILITLFVT